MQGGGKVRAMFIGALVASGCGSNFSDAGLCAQMWNNDVPTDLSERFTEAIVYPWTDKADDDGCGVMFVSGTGEPWVLFGGVVEDDRVATWDRVAGDRWGEDSPEGGSTDPNVVVLPGGLVSIPT